MAAIELPGLKGVALVASVCGHLGVVAMWLAWMPEPAVLDSRARTAAMVVQLIVDTPKPEDHGVAEGAYAAAGQITASPQRRPPQASHIDVEYLPARQLDTAPVPKSTPPIEQLAHVVFTGLPIRIRLLIDPLGRVQHIQVLQASPDDELAVEHVKAMYYATAYIPGRLNGAPIATQLDLELNLSQ